ncbi:MAG TPA: GGDEF domain-containing protein, partial [Longimicrobium sp.]|nr:GGDEF domain-containing protein [Longimicrobium sp.]
AASASRPSPRPKAPSPRVLIALVAVLLVAIGTALFLMLRSRGSVAPPPPSASAAAPGNPIGEATRLFQAGRVDEARQALLAIPATSPQYARAQKMLATFGPASTPAPGEAAATTSTSSPAAPPPTAEAQRKEAEAALASARDELEEINRELRALTIRDPLTGVFNRRYLDQRLAEALPLAVRGVQPLSVMICDIDDFKRINDTFSHAIGDEVLRVVAAILRQNVRQSDVVARFGGEEFVVLFPSTTLDRATAACEKVCRLVREHDWRALHPRLAVTISAGVAAADAQPTHEKLLSDADRKLYQAKRRGKDRVVV